jgi:mono/diheme cytochrome c family protein
VGKNWDPMPVSSVTFGVAALCAALSLGACKGSAPGDSRADAKRLFDSACGKCHGSDGRGGVPAAEGLAAPRSFVDASFQASRTDAQLRDAVVNGKGQMPPFGKVFDEAQLAQLVAHMRTFNPQK